jgi:tetratricopeptide (TPR) repeat protein
MDNRTRFERAVSLLDEGRAAEAAREFHALAMDTTDPIDRAMTLLNESGALCRSGDTVLARERWMEASSLVPEDSEFRPSIEVDEDSILTAEDRREEAFKVLARIATKYASRLANSERRDLYERIQINLGSHLVYLGRFSEARPFLEEALSFDESMKDATFYYDLGLMYYQLDQPVLSKEHFERALRMGLSDGWRGQAHYYLGLIDVGNQALARAKNEFELSLQDVERAKLSRQEIYGWLERLCSALELHEQAQSYRNLKNAS